MSASRVAAMSFVAALAVMSTGCANGGAPTPASPDSSTLIPSVAACTNEDVTVRHSAYAVADITLETILPVVVEARRTCQLAKQATLVAVDDPAPAQSPSYYVMKDSSIRVPSQPLILEPGSAVAVHLKWTVSQKPQGARLWAACPPDHVALVIGQVRTDIDTGCRVSDIGIAGPGLAPRSVLPNQGTTRASATVDSAG